MMIDMMKCLCDKIFWSEIKSMKQYSMISKAMRSDGSI